MLKWYWYVHVLFKQRLELLAEYKDAPGSQVEATQREISYYKEKVKERESQVNEQQRKLSQLLKEGSFRLIIWYNIIGLRYPVLCILINSSMHVLEDCEGVKTIQN